MSTDPSPAINIDDRRRGRALAVLCLGVMMNTLNATIVNVALASIGADLRLSEASLAWVINAYLATCGGCLLLGGRLGDLLGHRRVLLSGIMLFVIASLGCVLATSPSSLIAARALQGVGGAIVSATGLSLIMKLFSDTNQRAKALGTYALVSACGGSVGMLLGGIVTSALGWRWIFLINVPVGLCVCVSGLALLPRDSAASTRERLDVAGAAMITASTMLGIYALLYSSRAGSSTTHALAALGGASLLMMIFIRIEARARLPLVPLCLFRIRNLVVANCSGALLSAVALAWSFVTALYLQQVLDWSALHTGMVFLPANVATAVMSFAVTPMVIARFGVARPLVVGFTCAAIGLLLLAQVPVNASKALDVIPAMLFVGVGIGLAYSCVVLGAVSCTAPEHAGTASGIINTSFAVGGALGLAAFAAIAAARTNVLLGAGTAFPTALQGGYRLAFYSGAVLAATASIIGGLFLHTDQRTPARKYSGAIQ
jgi:EmrB/QacA subfamily drug resistance transporter